MVNIDFFSDPGEAPRSRDDVRFRKIGLFIHEDGRRIAVGFDITPFIERPSIEVRAFNARGDRVGSLNVIQSVETNFMLTMHLRDPEPEDYYRVTVDLYYASLEDGRTVVHSLAGDVDMTTRNRELIIPGETE